MLTEEEIKQYQYIHEKIYHTKIAREEARKLGMKLVTFLEVLFKQ